VSGAAQLIGTSQLKFSLVVDKLQFSGSATSALTADGSATGLDGAAGQLLAGDVALYVDNRAGNFTPEALARIDDAVSAINLVINPFGVAVTQVSDISWATTVLQIAADSAAGSAADGVLGSQD